MNILFMCVANSARSQIAEGLARHIFPEFQVHSAGSQPATLNPFAVTVLKEVGIDISNHYSKSYNDLPKDFTDNLDYIITLCAEEVCPVIVSKAKKIHWPLPDPASKKPLSDSEFLERFRIARDTIKARLLEFSKTCNDSNSKT